MRKTTKFALSICSVTLGLILTDSFTSPADGNTSAAPAARTGSPADGLNCTSCHTGTAATTAAGLITSTIPASGYIPGQTYTVTASITQAGKTKFGFEISPQTTTGVKKGTIVVTNTTATQLLTGGKYITHKTAGTSFPSGTATWSFNWTAPVAGSGDFTFYGAFNITNANGTSSGDIIKLSTLAVTENLSTGVEDLVLGDEINVFPNPVADKMHITSSSLQDAEMTITVININGQVVKKTDKVIMNSFIDLAELATGYYVLKIETEKGVAIKKIIKQ
ncbi:MAG TPA: choice-of-anchor V domain-containing protein [Bacteroidia bacterium]|jgi:hypothetical protein